jgi:hypothetical protein
MCVLQKLFTWHSTDCTIRRRSADSALVWPMLGHIQKYSKSCVTLCYLVLPYLIFGLSAFPALPHKVLLPCVSLKEELEWKSKKYFRSHSLSKIQQNQSQSRAEDRGQSLWTWRHFYVSRSTNFISAQRHGLQQCELTHVKSCRNCRGRVLESNEARLSF